MEIVVQHYKYVKNLWFMHFKEENAEFYVMWILSQYEFVEKREHGF